ncbi:MULTISPECIES: hypothetical protein [unclassified Streptomyces]|uniref:hypothetical protein n=1 Tax=unclassified Streptomyces TaxID=2593676 RepID=UPI002E81CD46|nr:hypothetical protein [Streptomyces sp. NBC_00562]WTC76844.1 hypothetical protein OH719_01945 [Streptomyces sp. NBC_01653]WTD30922.1 hypothetical protein OHB03_00815 [Streptomyces sp. NBC_01643]WTD86507.1 hypothetical protein OG891_01945 [Streptomyces sp. NBC_01637]WTC84358.1 hypothetical protein OH719_44920 [Streptomyces sp. NBC_01653]WTD38740.1 hypothetical protein OHB03_45455 [Streptomyces sp. NBC_01643]
MLAIIGVRAGIAEDEAADLNRDPVDILGAVLGTAMRVVGVVAAVNVLRGLPKNRTPIGAALTDTATEVTSGIAVSGTVLAVHRRHRHIELEHAADRTVPRGSHDHRPRAHSCGCSTRRPGNPAHTERRGLAVADGQGPGSFGPGTTRAHALAGPGGPDHAASGGLGPVADHEAGQGTPLAASHGVT